MRQLFLENGLIAIKNVAEPLLDDNLVLVQVHYSCISPGTENATITQAQQNPLTTNIPQKIAKALVSFATHGLEGTKALIRERLSGPVYNLGYSCSGQVIAVGKNIKNVRAGDLVACAGAGYANHADIICVPENLVVKISDEKHLASASVTTLGAIALQGVRRAQLQLGESVCVIGLGLLGQLTVQLAKLSGCTVYGIDLMKDRCDMALELGADQVYNSTEQNFLDEIRSATQRHGVDCTIITAASTSNAIIQQAMELTRKKGKVVLVGDVGLNIERSPLYQKEIDFLISCSYGPGRYDVSYEQYGIDYPYPFVRWTENRNMQTFVELLEHKKITIEKIISECMTVEEADIGYKKLQEKKALGIILDFTNKSFKTEGNDTNSLVNALLNKFTTAKQDIRVGVIGAGGFAKIKLMPIIARMKNVTINAIVDANISNSLSIAKVYQPSKVLTNDTDLFKEDIIDAVVIASPHKYHSEQALQALRNGKAVFLEKPMVTDFNQLEQFAEFIKNNQDARLCVDYNRSFAPCIERIKETITTRTSPLVIAYRMNAGFIPKSHWVQTEVGAGRIIGEACHIIDLFHFLTDSYPRCVSVESLQPATDDLLPSDNFSVQITFMDGSVCSLVYTALGHPNMGKERMELFFDGKSIIMDDYKSLKGFGLHSSFNMSTQTVDKGHEALLHQFFDALKKDSFSHPINLKRLYSVAHTTLIIDQLACRGGGEKEL
jgi:predicted dehydrogenase/threonine dehydrogenase-like Zn-dependent dehydrogenase